MEVSNLLVSEAHALGMDEGLASQLTKILEPLIEALREPHDLGPVSYTHLTLPTKA